jgi:hypothetical protein
MESHDVEVRKRAIQQLVVELLAPYHSRLQPVELAWPSTKTSSHEQQLWLTLQHEPEPRVIISLGPHQGAIKLFIGEYNLTRAAALRGSHYQSALGCDKGLSPR